MSTTIVRLKQKSIDNHQIINAFYQSGWLDSNQRPHAPQTRTLTSVYHWKSMLSLPFLFLGWLL